MHHGTIISGGINGEQQVSAKTGYRLKAESKAIHSRSPGLCAGCCHLDSEPLDMGKRYVRDKWGSNPFGHGHFLCA